MPLQELVKVRKDGWQGLPENAGGGTPLDHGDIRAGMDDPSLAILDRDKKPVRLDGSDQMDRLLIAGGQRRPLW